MTRLRLRMADQAVEHVRARFTVEKAVDTLTIYDRL